MTSVVGAAFLSPAAAHAASGPDAQGAAASTSVGEVIVTARRRNETAQKVPVAVTAFSAQTLHERRIADAQDLQGQVPALSVSAGGQSRDVETIAVRGQSTTYTAAPAVPIYLAEVPLIVGRVATLQGPPGQFLDLADIQILRGPQGTLFGRNSTGGAVLLEPARPTDRFEGYIQAQGGDYGDNEFEGVINVPVSDKLKFRIAGRYADRGGFTKDVLTGVDYDNLHYYTGRFGLTWTPTDRIENYLMVTGSHSTSNGSGYVIGQFNDPFLNAVFGAAGGCAGVGFGPNCSVLDGLVAAQNARGPRRVALGPPPLAGEITGWSVVDRLRVQLNDNLTVRNIVSYGELRALTGFDGDGTPLALYQTGMGPGPADNVRQFTEEFQLQGTSLGRKLHYTAGLYYEHTGTPGDEFVENSGINFFVPNLAGARYKTQAVALYAQGDLDFGVLNQALAGLKLTAGLRYTWDSYSGAGATATTDGAGDVIACNNGVNVVPTTIADCAIPASGRSSEPTWTVGLEYQATPNVMVYGKVSRGYKTGGINLQAVNPGSLTYRPEFVTTYEAGAKTRMRLGGDADLTLNGDVFRTDYSNIQVAGADFNPVSFAGGAAIFNAASARIEGVELESVLRLSRDLTLSGTYSYIYSHYNTFSINVSPILAQLDCSGQITSGALNLACVPMPYVPKNQFNLAARYALPIPGDRGHLVFSAVYAYTGQQWQTATTVPIELPEADNGGGEPGLLIKGYGLLNLSLSWNEFMGRPVDIDFFITNATNETYRVSNTGTFYSLGTQASLYGAPRMFGASIRYRF